MFFYPVGPQKAQMPLKPKRKVVDGASMVQEWCKKIGKSVVIPRPYGVMIYNI